MISLIYCSFSVMALLAIHISQSPKGSWANKTADFPNPTLRTCCESNQVKRKTASVFLKPGRKSWLTLLSLDSWRTNWFVWSCDTTLAAWNYTKSHLDNENLVVFCHTNHLTHVLFAAMLVIRWALSKTENCHIKPLLTFEPRFLIKQSKAN